MLRWDVAAPIDTVHTPQWGQGGHSREMGQSSKGKLRQPRREPWEGGEGRGRRGAACGPKTLCRAGRGSRGKGHLAQGADTALQSKGLKLGTEINGQRCRATGDTVSMAVHTRLSPPHSTSRRGPTAGEKNRGQGGHCAKTHGAPRASPTLQEGFAPSTDRGKGPCGATAHGQPRVPPLPLRPASLLPEEERLQGAVIAECRWRRAERPCAGAGTGKANLEIRCRPRAGTAREGSAL